jgi:alpha-tubulin suppressor-like RCC1 family protein
VVQVALGYGHTCARRSDGSLWCWGLAEDGQFGDGLNKRASSPVQASAAAAPAVGLAAGSRHTCALKNDGTVWCWGRNGSGQLGNGTTATTLMPPAAPVMGLGATVAEVVAGSDFTCARKTDGTLWCWGANRFGQLGDGTTTDRSTAVQVSGLGGQATAVWAGAYHGCARRMDGTLLCWGLNDDGQLGDGTTTNRPSPVAVDALGATVAAAAAGGAHTCARKTDGTLSCWGLNASGQLGALGMSTAVPREVMALGRRVLEVAAGPAHTCAIVTGGAIECWGSNQAGEIGDGTPFHRARPAQVEVGGPVAEVVSGSGFTCARKVDGTAWCWGADRAFQLAHPSGVEQPRPVQVASLGGALAGVAAGPRHACGWRQDGALLCWGEDTSGQIGDGATSPWRASPTAVVNLGPVLAAAAGYAHSCAIKRDHSLWCWGGDGFGALGDGGMTASPVPVAVPALGPAVAQVALGFMKTCALKTDGTLWCWGANPPVAPGSGVNTGPVQVTALGASVTAVALGQLHGCALKKEGALFCWGLNGWGEVGVGNTQLQTLPVEVVGLGAMVTAMAAGEDHTCAVKTDGTVACWGNNRYGQLGDGSQIDRSTPVPVAGLGAGVVAVTAGFRHTCALKRDGTLWCWGASGSGQLGDGQPGSLPTPRPVCQ